jgi:phosphomannomutase
LKNLLFSVSGARGVIGQGLDPLVFTNLAAHFGIWCGRGRIVVGRDSRVSGEMALSAVSAGLLGVGCDVIDLGIVATPTVEVAVRKLDAKGGIQISASHNPEQWNALKLLSSRGIFLTDSEGASLKARIDSGPPEFAAWDKLGKKTERGDLTTAHIDRILAFSPLDAERIRSAGIIAVVDCVAGAGGAGARQLLDRLGVSAVWIHAEPTGRFPRNPEPLAEHLEELSRGVRAARADIGFALDPDADRVAVVDETGNPIGEERTLAGVIDSFLPYLRSDVVVNASTTMAIDDIAARHGVRVHRTPVGEVHVTEKMLALGARIGGEGNGGIIVPEVNPGRDAFLGMALWLSAMARENAKVSELASRIPPTFLRKERIEAKDVDWNRAVAELRRGFPAAQVETIDGLKLLFEDGWVHVRKSNTEPIVRLLAEARTSDRVEDLVRQAKGFIEGARAARAT